MNFCPDCGEPVAGQNFCPNCGTSLLSKSQIGSSGAQVPAESVDRTSLHLDDLAEDLVVALVAYDKKDWEGAEALLAPIALTGNITAIFKLANTISNRGRGPEAMNWLRLAAEWGHAASASNLGYQLEQINELEESRDWYLKAHELGEPRGLLYYALTFAEEDEERIPALRAAMDAGMPRARAILGAELHQKGNVEGLELLRQAAREGSLAAVAFLCKTLTIECEWAEVFELADTAIRGPRDAEGEHMLGNLYGARGISRHFLKEEAMGLEDIEEAKRRGFDTESLEAVITTYSFPAAYPAILAAFTSHGHTSFEFRLRVTDTENPIHVVVAAGAPDNGKWKLAVEVVGGELFDHTPSELWGCGWIENKEAASSFTKILPQGTPGSLYIEFRQAFSALGLTREDVALATADDTSSSTISRSVGKQATKAKIDNSASIGGGNIDAELEEITGILALLRTVPSDKWPENAPHLFDRKAELERLLAADKKVVLVEVQCVQSERQVIWADESLEPSQLRFGIEWDELKSNPYASSSALRSGLTVTTKTEECRMTVEESGLDTDGHEVRAFAGRTDEGIRAGLAGNPASPYEALRVLAMDKATEDGRPRVRQGVARNASTPQDLLDRLALDSDPSVREIVAKNAGISNAQLTELAGDPDKKVRGAVAQNPNAHGDFIALLATDVEADVRWSVALSSLQKLPAQIVEALANDSDSKVRRMVAGGTGTPQDLLVALARDDSAEVRNQVARNPNTAESVLSILANDVEPRVRWCVADNPSCPVELLASLAHGTDGDVREAVSENPSSPPYLLAELHELGETGLVQPSSSTIPNEWRVRGVRTKLAKNPNSPSHLLEALAEDDHGPVLRELGGNPNAPLDLIHRLGNDQRSEAREGVAANPKAPVTVLEALAKDRDDTVRRALASNPNIATAPVALTTLMTDPDEKVRSAIAKNPQIPADELRTLAKDPSATVRGALASNPEASAAVLADLAADKDESVIEAVSKNKNTPTATLLKMFEISEKQASQADTYNRLMLVETTFTTTLHVALEPQTSAGDFWDSVTWPVFYGNNFYVVDAQEMSSSVTIHCDGEKVLERLN